jgi:O-antigen ligase
MINTDPFENSNRMMRTHTSGRVALWKSSWNFINKRPYLGYGAAADRYLISENSSNIYIYTLLSSGFLGLAIIVTINLLVIYSIIKIIFFHKIFNKKGAILLKFSTLTILFLLLRSLVENSYSVFGLDLLIFLICYSLIRIFLDDAQLIYLKKL